MKKYILILVMFLAGCSSLKTTDQRAFTWNGDAAVSYMQANALARQRADSELNRMLREFPYNTFDLQVGIIESRPDATGRLSLVIPVKLNFKRDWLIKFFQHLYALNEDDGGMAQITVKTLYDMYDTNDVYNKADNIQGIVSFRDLGRFTQIQSRMVSARPNLLVAVLDSKDRVIFRQVVDTPPLSHSGVYSGIPVFVDVGNRSNYTRFNLKWPVAPYQMTIDGSQPILTTAQITLDPSLAVQAHKIRVDVILQN